jgi:hypothetical protein
LKSLTTFTNFPVFHCADLIKTEQNDCTALGDSPLTADDVSTLSNLPHHPLLQPPMSLPNQNTFAPSISTRASKRAYPLFDPPLPADPPLDPGFSDLTARAASRASVSPTALTSSTNPTMSTTFFYPPGRPPGVIHTWTIPLTKTQDQEFFSHDGFSSLIFSSTTACLPLLASRPSTASKPSFTS